VLGTAPYVVALAVALGPTDTAVQVASTAGTSLQGFLRIDGEIVCYVSKTSTTFTLRSVNGRGCLGTTAASHAQGATVVEFHLGRMVHSRISDNVSRAEVLVVGGTRPLGDGANTVIDLETSIEDTYSPSWGAYIHKPNFLDGFTIRGGAIDMGAGVGAENQTGASYLFCKNVTLETDVLNAQEFGYYLVSCLYWRINENYFRGKTALDVNAASYPALIRDLSRWGQFRGNVGENVYQMAVFSSEPQFVGCTDEGFVRDVVVTDNDILSGGIPGGDPHYGYIVHNSGANIAFANNGAGSQMAYYEVEGGENITIKGRTVGPMIGNVLRLDGCTYVDGLFVEDVYFNNAPSLLVGETVLTAGIGSTDTTIPVFSANALTSVSAGGSATMVQIDSEIIEVTAVSGDGLSYTGCIRGRQGTTAATHASGARVYPQGDALKIPIFL